MRKSNGKLPHLFIPSKTATLVPDFAVKDLPFGRRLWRWWWCWWVYTYVWGFRERLHLRPMTPVLNDFDAYNGQWYPRMRGLKISQNLSYNWGKPPENLNQENWLVRGSNPGSLGERQRCYPSTRAVVVNLLLWKRSTSISSLQSLLASTDIWYYIPAWRQWPFI